MWEQRVALKDRVDVAMLSGRGGDIFTVEHQYASVTLLQPGNQPQNGGLAAAGRAEQGDKFAVADGEIKIGNNRFAVKKLY